MCRELDEYEAWIGLFPCLLLKYQLLGYTGPTGLLIYSLTIQALNANIFINNEKKGNNNEDDGYTVLKAPFPSTSLYCYNTNQLTSDKI